MTHWGVSMTENDNRRRLTRRRVLQGIGAAGAASVLGGTEVLAQNDDRLELAQVKSPIEFDPIVLNDVPSAQVAQLIFSGLYTYDESTNIAPKLAASEPEVQDGGETWVVELKEGATFHNGDSVTAEDVAYSFMAPIEEETENAAEVEMIDSVDAVDERTAQFNLKYPYGAFEHVLAGNVVPESAREEDREAFNTEQPIGSGPYRFVDWQEGNFVRVEAWDDYWGDPGPAFNEIELRPVEEPTTRVTSLRTGEFDAMEEIPPRLYPEVEGMDDVSIDELLGIGYFYLAFNCNEGPTADPQVREAIDYTFSMDQAVSNFVEPTGERQYSPIPRAVVEEWEFPVEEWQGIPHDKDIEQAQQLFSEADVPDDWEARIIVPPDDKREQIGVTVANGLQEAGYGASVQRLDWGAFLEQYISGDPNDYNMYTLGWAGVPDPDSFTYYLFAQDVQGTTDGTFYQNDEVNEQIVQARESNDQEERKPLYEDAITTLLEDRVHLPAYNLKNSFAVKNYVENFSAHPVQSFQLAAV
jgi:peptide/nickel transport system substrate-binding protein